MKMLWPVVAQSLSQDWAVLTKILKRDLGSAGAWMRVRLISHESGWRNQPWSESN